MARPIPLELPKRDPREELRLRVEQAPVEHAEAILAGFEVLQGLHDAGLLEILRGLLGSGDKVLQIAVDAANTPDGIRAMRNLLILTKTLGSLDPEVLEKIARSVPETLNAAKQAAEAPAPGLWELAKRFRAVEMRRGLAVVNSILAVLGRTFGKS